MSARKIQSPRHRGPLPGPSAKAVRFSIVVQSCGRPEIVYLWAEPEANKKFMKAVSEHRVMTLAQSTVGTQKDFGVIGFFENENAAYLVFPRPLNAFHPKRVVGVNYDLIKIPGPIGPTVNPTDGEPGSPTRKPAPRPKKFKVKLRFTATTEVVREIEADSRKDAIEKASKTAPPPDFSHATISRKVIKAEGE